MLNDDVDLGLSALTVDDETVAAIAESPQEEAASDGASSNEVLEVDSQFDASANLHKGDDEDSRSTVSGLEEFVDSCLSVLFSACLLLTDQQGSSTCERNRGTIKRSTRHG